MEYSEHLRRKGGPRKTQYMAQYTCLQCGAMFERPGERGYIYCSPTCFHKSRIGISIPKPMLRKEKKLLQHICRWCGTTFRSLPCAGAKRFFCSPSCQGYAHSRHPKPLVLSREDAAYLAGIIDGEGSISITYRKNRPSSTRPSIRVHIGNSYAPLLEWIRSRTGTGLVSECHPGPLGHKPMWYWSVTSIAAVFTLRQVVPYLLEKQQRAMSAIASQPLADPITHSEALIAGVVP